MTMAIPYHLLKECGDIIFAARGSDIHSFTSTFEYISTWKYPAKQADAPSDPPSVTPESSAPEGPPAKRRKVQDGEQSPSNGNTAGASNGQRKTKKNYQQNPANEKPFIQGLYATTDGRHLLAITGSDKTIWVFEHDGSGHLNQLSQRAMPKRPCALALTLDGRTILSADKFGDVYALPLLPTSSPLPHHQQQPQPQARASQSPSPLTPAGPFKPQADERTVHTKRNLRALENQKISLSKKAAAAAAAAADDSADRPQFEHTLLLGHVSMLTAICVGTETVREGEGKTRTREYILTADRDEHIKVSRGMPYAYIIEIFCLGHEEFVSQLCMAPGGREGVLISGGGDDDLFVWDWVKGKVLCRAGLLRHVQEVVDGADRLAVTRLVAYRWEGEGETPATTGVFVTCERVPALFHYHLLDNNSLRHHETIRLPGNPLDVEVLGSGRLLVAADPGASAATEGASAAPSLFVLDREDTGSEAGCWRQSPVAPENVPEAAALGAQELHKILYSTESLRKLADSD